MYVSMTLLLYFLLPGALDFLERPTVVFVRLKESAPLDSALEAPQPVRFVFVLVGPSKSDVDYRETGRAMAALMADKVSSANETSEKEITKVQSLISVRPRCSIRQCSRQRVLAS